MNSKPDSHTLIAVSFTEKQWSFCKDEIDQIIEDCPKGTVIQTGRNIWVFKTQEAYPWINSLKQYLVKEAVLFLSTCIVAPVEGGLSKAQIGEFKNLGVTIFSLRMPED